MINFSNDDWVSVLSQYNAEVARGIIHTNEWIQEMKKLQERFDNDRS